MAGKIWTQSVVSLGGGSFDPTAEPFFNAGVGDVIVHQGDSNASFYASNAAWQASGSPSVARVTPNPSAFQGGTFDAAKTTLSTGIAGGKAFDVIYAGGGSENPECILIQCPVPGTLEWFLKFSFKVLGSLSIGTYLTSKCVMVRDDDGDRYQPCLKDPYPPKTFRSDICDAGTAIMFYGPNAADDPAALPDQGIQKIGPYWYQLNDGNWHTYTLWGRPHWSAGQKDGGSRLWIDGAKVMDVSLTGVDITPVGGLYPYCKAPFHQAAFKNQVGIQTTNSVYWGADTSGSTTPWTLRVDINSLQFVKRART